MLGQAHWPPLGPSLSGTTPKATGFRSGLQSMPNLPALVSPLTAVFPLTDYTQQLFLISSRQQLAPAAPTRRSALLACGPPSPMRTCSRSGHASTHASIRHRSWSRAQACQQRSDSNRLRRSPAADRRRDRIAPIPAAFQPVQGPPPRQPADPTVPAAWLGPDRCPAALRSACTPSSHAIRCPTVLSILSRNTAKKSQKRKYLLSLDATTSSRSLTGAHVHNTLGTSSGRASTRRTLSLCRSPLRLTTIARFAQERERRAPDHGRRRIRLCMAGSSAPMALHPWTTAVTASLLRPRHHLLPRPLHHSQLLGQATAG